ncbi:MAG: pirin family protein [Candidatus Velthaea sp.]
MPARTPQRTVAALTVREGGGFLVHRPFPTQALMDVDPFLMIDELGPVDYGPGEAIGAPDHPHRGFEIISYVLSGASQHKDSFGHHGELYDGDLQYMLAGAGVVHREMPADSVMRDGGHVHGIQLWINVPAKDKALRPRYVDIRAASIPVYTAPDGAFAAKILAGNAFGIDGKVQTQHPTDYLHVTIAPGAHADIPVRRDTTALAYILDGTVDVSATREVRSHELVIYNADGESIAVDNTGATPANLIILVSAPLGEPIARYGPFVMNTEREIQQAFADYRDGMMGAIEPERVSA